MKPATGTIPTLPCVSAPWSSQKARLDLLGQQQEMEPWERAQHAAPSSPNSCPEYHPPFPGLACPTPVTPSPPAPSLTSCFTGSHSNSSTKMDEGPRGHLRGLTSGFSRAQAPGTLSQVHPPVAAIRLAQLHCKEGAPLDGMPACYPGHSHARQYILSR